MALVNCPECGAQDISDTAVICPNCGYAIKKHFDRISQQQKLAKVKEKLAPELECELKEIDQMPYPQKPKLIEKFNNGWVYGTFGALALFLLIGVYLYLKGNSNSATDFMISSMALWTLWVFGLLLRRLDLYAKELILYNKAEDWGKYKEECKKKAEEKYNEYAKNIIKYGTREPSKRKAEMNDANGESAPECPACGSTQVHKISAFNRAVSVAFLGQASSKFEKQYECGACKYKW